MAAKKVGELVKEARTAAKLTQEKLAQAVGGNLTAADISKCERGEADLSAAQLKKIAAACGVTQASLVNAPKNLNTTASKTASAKKTTAKTTAAKTSTAKASAAKTSSGKAAAKTSGKTAAAKKTTGKTAAKTPANANTSMKVTAAEKKLIEAYRESTSDRKKAALKLLNGEYGDAIDKLLSVTNGTSSSSSSSSSSAPEAIGDVLGNLLGGLFGGK